MSRTLTSTPQGLRAAGWQTRPADRVLVAALGALLLPALLASGSTLLLGLGLAAVLRLASKRGRPGLARYLAGHLLSLVSMAFGIAALVLSVPAAADGLAGAGGLLLGVVLCAGGVAGCRLLWREPVRTWWLLAGPVVFTALSGLLVMLYALG